MGPLAAAAAVRAGGRTPVELVEKALAAAEALDPVLHFAESLDPAGALAAARRVSPELPLAGVPFLIKSGTAAGSPVVTRLVAAGAIPIGVSTRNRPGTDSQTHGWNGTDYTRNPWDLTRSPGGSSAGAAAAVAAGVVPLATGGDSGGSLRIPAAFCGVTGFKGSAGRVPRPGRPLIGLAVSGLIGADLDDVVTATSLISGPERCDPSASPFWPVPVTEPGRRLRVAFLTSFGRGTADSAVAAVVRDRIAAGMSLEGPAGLDLVGVVLDLAAPEDAWDTLAALDAGRGVSGDQVRHATELRRAADRALADVFDTVDAIVTPTTLTVAHPYDGPVTSDFVGDLCWDFNITGHPAVSVPAGLAEGLPVGLQVVAGHGRDDVAVTVARLLRVTLPPPPVSA
ncbi:Asp-tRNAAsn/Glu-tRNAGln amidotransferase A subunit [Actinoplanes derwentensis]|uniref:Asp-tRNAAsn/Glu-tRNAGln amidotransferase A subunit n=1 Tax=Actinoplanes derwentensis TaxID=113562 RepID=A0A1H1Y4H5_9ACTN|nr:amidase [Actinoplanes derwentensis]SDT16314.1 Asp-tRNAAsn/Glu-tRNAGln amidotransferase A subunit [Actinoplanes derwentensis]